MDSARCPLEEVRSNAARCAEPDPCPLQIVEVIGKHVLMNYAVLTGTAEDHHRVFVYNGRVRVPAADRGTHCFDKG